MRKLWSSFVVCGVLAVSFFLAGAAHAADAKEKKEKKEAPKVEEAATPAVEAAAAETKEAPEFIVYDKAKNGTVTFPHKKHAEMAGKCDACHGGETPIFAQKKTEGMLMKDMYAGKLCGACHDGKKHGETVVFPAKGACGKCHKKSAK
ncbi:MAG: c(7)-type cytochrome triheme domain-containing protein [Elusimicrobiota bacterium]